MAGSMTIMMLIIYFFMLFTAVFWLIVWFENRKIVFNDPKPKTLPAITIVIPAYNEEENIANSIESCLSLNYPKNKLKLIVVNDGSTDKTKQVSPKTGWFVQWNSD